MAREMTDETVNAERRRELGRFLRNRRARLRPGDVGLPASRNRRVAGLRREEVAALAGVGVTWYTMLESGAADGVSTATLDAIATALALSRDETAYVHALADRHASPEPQRTIDPLALATLDAIPYAPAYVCTSQWTVLRWNRAMSVVWGIEPPGGAPFNVVVRTFADPRMRALHGDGFEGFARALVAMVRSGAGPRIADPVYCAIYDELRDDAVFAAAWDAYDVALPSGGPARRTAIVSANVGPFAYEAFTLLMPGVAGHSIVVQIPDAASAARLRVALEG